MCASSIRWHPPRPARRPEDFDAPDFGHGVRSNCRYGDAGGSIVSRHQRSIHEFRHHVNNHIVKPHCPAFIMFDVVKRMNRLARFDSKARFLPDLPLRCLLQRLSQLHRAPGNRPDPFVRGGAPFDQQNLVFIYDHGSGSYLWRLWVVVLCHISLFPRKPVKPNNLHRQTVFKRFRNNRFRRSNQITAKFCRRNFVANFCCWVPATPRFPSSSHCEAPSIPALSPREPNLPSLTRYPL